MLLEQWKVSSGLIHSSAFDSYLQGQEILVNRIYISQEDDCLTKMFALVLPTKNYSSFSAQLVIHYSGLAQEIHLCKLASDTFHFHPLTTEHP